MHRTCFESHKCQLEGKHTKNTINAILLFSEFSSLFKSWFRVFDCSPVYKKLLWTFFTSFKFFDLIQSKSFKANIIWANFKPLMLKYISIVMSLHNTTSNKFQICSDSPDIKLKQKFIHYSRKLLFSAFWNRVELYE